MIEAPILWFLDFYIPFKIACDAFGVCIGGMLSHEGYLVAFFSEKLSDAKCMYLTYDKKFYATVKSKALTLLLVIE